MATIGTLLVERTDHLHERFDAQYETVLFFDVTQEKYHDFMRKLYSYYVPAEEQLQHLEKAKTPACFLHDKKRVPFLKQDLLALGETPETLAHLPLYPQMPPLETVPQALGYLYIIEGSIFGNGPVAQQINTNLQITEENGGSFFWMVEPELVRVRWTAFQKMLNTYADAHPEDVETIIQSAIETILTYEDCLFEGKVTNIQRIDSSLHGHSHDHGHAHSHDHEHSESH